MIENVAPSVLPFGIGREQLSIPLSGDTSIAIDIAAAEAQIELLPFVTVGVVDPKNWTGA
jgi:hypothetical protein